MTRRYYCPCLPTDGGVVALTPEQAAHAIRVMRIDVGDEVELFDGKGHQSKARVASLSRRDCVCHAEPTIDLPRMPSIAISMGIALPKPDRARDLIERLTELGVDRVIPLVADRTQRPPSDSVLKKLERVVVEACKQSGRNQLLVIEDRMTSSEYFGALAQKTTRPRYIAHVNSGTCDWTSPQPGEAVDIAIGPEGGWTDQEFELAKQSGFRSVQLGERVLRIETAAAAMAAGLSINR